MRVYDIRKPDGIVFAFEVDVWFGRRFASRIASRINDVRLLRRPKFLSWFREEVFCEFELHGHRFQIWEPFGDNSRHWVGPSDGTATSAVEQVRKAFVDYKLQYLGISIVP